MASKGKPKLNKVAPTVTCDDYPTKYAGLGVRAVFAILGYAALGNNIGNGEAFFATAFLYDAPLCLDYWRYNPNSTGRIVLNFIARIYHTTILLLAVIGLFGILKVDKIDVSIAVYTAETFIYPNICLGSLQSWWWAMVGSIILCVVDWLINKSAQEKEIIMQGRELRNGK